MTESSVPQRPPQIVYAGDRDISVRVLRFITGQGLRPLALMVPDDAIATHAQKLVTLCNYPDDSRILQGDQFRKERGLNLLRELEPDYIISVHFPYVMPREVLEIPKRGVVNLHPAYLPYNRGWHTPTWAIWEGTPYGATLHFVDEGIDTGDIIHQKQIEISPNDTAHTLYNRVKKVEFEVFKEAWPSILSGTYRRQPQPAREGTTHRKTDIKSIQPIDLDQEVKAEELIRRLRALTTNRVSESAYIEVKGKRYHIQVRILEE